MNSQNFSGARTVEAIAAAKQVVAVVAMHPALIGILDGCISVIEVMAQIRLPSGILIRADPGMGKTLLLDLLKRRLSASDQTIEGRHTCVHVELEAGADIYGVAASTMLALGYPMLPSTPKLQNMNQMIDKGFEKLKPKVILFDELQHVCEGNKDIKARHTTDWIKVRMDRHNCPVIGAGTSTIERLSEINPQFTSRTSASYELTPFVFGDSWRQVMGSFRQMVTTVDMGIIEGPDSRRIHAATKGNMRALKRLLMYSAMHAASKTVRQMTRGDLAEGYKNATGERGEVANPFTDWAGSTS